MSSKKETARAFRWGRREHVFERWTNLALATTIVLFAVSFYLKSWFLMQFTFAWLAISLSIHLIARFCHRRENRWHNR